MRNLKSTVNNVEHRESQRQMDELFRALIENAMDIITIIDDDGIIHYQTPPVERVLGYKQAELIGMNIMDLLHLEDVPKVLEAIKATASAKYSNPEDMQIVEARLRHKDGSWRTLESIIKELPIISSKVSIVINSRDVTKRKQAEEELILAKEHAEQSDKMKSAFLANMSHEIRTPINGILGFSELLKEPGLTGERQQEYIRIIEKSGARMLNIINEIVDISKIEANLMKVDITSVNINDKIEFIYDFFKPMVEEKGMQISFKNTLPANEAIIRTDNEKIYSIITNLVKNSIKYSEVGTIELGYFRKGEALEFYVKDTGIGIPEDRQSAIFERFIQADITNSMARQGAGLGLAIAKAYVEMLGGKIWVESEEGIGSTFCFTLPYDAVQVEKKKIKKNVLEKDVENHRDLKVSGLKILIAEDDEISEMIISIIIKKYGKEILKARNGKEAVDIIRNNSDIDLIMMDIQMPVMNGYEATRQIRTFNNKVVIIAQTAFALSSDREKSIVAGCNDHITKPINKNELLSLIEKYFTSN
jgi:PAS domain S-box-containing protein